MKSLADIDGYLRPLYEKAHQLTGLDITIERTQKLLAQVGNPHERLRVIHIAGTSGKTSTSYYIAEMLHLNGVKVGLTVSPHISSITERLQLGGVPVSEKTFIDYFSEFTDLLGEQPDATYFELLIAFVLWVFDKEAVEYAVLETGLGGLHDSTNVTMREDKLCVITDIGYDHEHILGRTIDKIAYQKAGIIHPKNHVFMFNQEDAVMDVLLAKVEKEGSYLHTIIENDIASAPAWLPAYQKRNWSLAQKVVMHVAHRDGVQVSADKLIDAAHIQVPGRMHIIKNADKIVILDGAHNVQKMSVFVHSFQNAYGDVRVSVMLAMKIGKDYEQVIKILKPITSKIICTSFKKEQDLQHTSVDPVLIAAICEKEEIPVEIQPTVVDAYAALRKSNEPITVVTGSLYVLGEILAIST